jgi:hypothetical protein
MKIVRVLIVMFALLVASEVQTHAIEVVPSPPAPLASSPLIVTEFLANQNQIEYLQLFNNSDEAQSLSNWKWVMQYRDGVNTFEVSLGDEYVPPKQYIVLSAGNALASDAVQSLAAVEVFEAGDSFRLESTLGLYAPEPVPVATSEQNVRYHRYTSSAGNYTATRTFSKLANQQAPVVSDATYMPRADFPLAPIEILANAKNCTPGDQDAACGDYVKFHNNTDQVVDFAGVRLRIRYQGQTTSSSNSIALGGQVDPGEYVLFNTTAAGLPLSLTNSGAFVWLEDIYGVEHYENTVIEYPDASNRKGRSWAQDGTGEWYWATPNPAGENINAEPPPLAPVVTRELTPCSEDQIRNPVTNRCNKIAAPSVPVACDADQERNLETGRCRKVVQSPTVKPCNADQERNPETGRCRKVSGVGATGSLTPCKPGQVRNSETNRCRSVQQASSALKPCATGQERNPETNRCRKVKADPIQSDFAVETVAASKDTIASWWALGGVGTLALGYAGWEWRSEAARLMRRVREFFLTKG